MIPQSSITSWSAPAATTSSAKPWRERIDATPATWLMYGTSATGYLRYWFLCQTAAQSNADFRSGGFGGTDVLTLRL